MYHIAVEYFLHACGMSFVSDGFSPQDYDKGDKKQAAMYAGIVAAAFFLGNALFAYKVCVLSPFLFSKGSVLQNLCGGTFI